MTLNAYIASGAATIATGLSQVPTNGALETWIALAIQAGMAGVVVIILFKSFPMLIADMKAQREAHEATITRIVEANTRKDDDWQRIVVEKLEAGTIHERIRKELEALKRK